MKCSSGVTEINSQNHRFRKTNKRVPVISWFLLLLLLLLLAPIVTPYPIVAEPSGLVHLPPNKSYITNSSSSSSSSSDDIKIFENVDTIETLLFDFITSKKIAAARSSRLTEDYNTDEKYVRQQPPRNNDENRLLTPRKRRRRQLELKAIIYLCQQRQGLLLTDNETHLGGQRGLLIDNETRLGKPGQLIEIVTRLEAPGTQTKNETSLEKTAAAGQQIETEIRLEKQPRKPNESETGLGKKQPREIPEEIFPKSLENIDWHAFCQLISRKQHMKTPWKDRRDKTDEKLPLLIREKNAAAPTNIYDDNGKRQIIERLRQRFQPKQRHKRQANLKQPKSASVAEKESESVQTQEEPGGYRVPFLIFLGAFGILFVIGLVAFISLTAVHCTQNKVNEDSKRNSKRNQDTLGDTGAKQTSNKRPIPVSNDTKSNSVSSKTPTSQSSKEKKSKEKDRRKQKDGKQKKNEQSYPKDEPVKTRPFQTDHRTAKMSFDGKENDKAAKDKTKDNKGKNDRKVRKEGASDSETSTTGKQGSKRKVAAEKSPVQIKSQHQHRDKKRGETDLTNKTKPADKRASKSDGQLSEKEKSKMMKDTKLKAAAGDLGDSKRRDQDLIKSGKSTDSLMSKDKAGKQTTENGRKVKEHRRDKSNRRDKERYFVVQKVSESEGAADRKNYYEPKNGKKPADHLVTKDTSGRSNREEKGDREKEKDIEKPSGPSLSEKREKEKKKDNKTKEGEKKKKKKEEEPEDERSGRASRTISKKKPDGDGGGKSALPAKMERRKSISEASVSEKSPAVRWKNSAHYHRVPREKTKVPSDRSTRSDAASRERMEKDPGSRYHTDKVAGVGGKLPLPSKMERKKSISEASISEKPAHRDRVPKEKSTRRDAASSERNEKDPRSRYRAEEAALPSKMERKKNISEASISAKSAHHHRVRGEKTKVPKEKSTRRAATSSERSEKDPGSRYCAEEDAGIGGKLAKMERKKSISEASISEKSPAVPVRQTRSAHHERVPGVKTKVPNLRSTKSDAALSERSESSRCHAKEDPGLRSLTSSALMQARRQSNDKKKKHTAKASPSGKYEREKKEKKPIKMKEQYDTDDSSDTEREPGAAKTKSKIIKIIKDKKGESWAGNIEKEDFIVDDIQVKKIKMDLDSKGKLQRIRVRPNETGLHRKNQQKLVMVLRKNMDSKNEDKDQRRQGQQQTPTTSSYTTTTTTTTTTATTGRRQTPTSKSHRRPQQYTSADDDISSSLEDLGVHHKISQRFIVDSTFSSATSPTTIIYGGGTPMTITKREQHDGSTSLPSISIAEEIPHDQPLPPGMRRLPHEREAEADARLHRFHQLLRQQKQQQQQQQSRQDNDQAVAVQRPQQSRAELPSHLHLHDSPPSSTNPVSGILQTEWKPRPKFSFASTALTPGLQSSFPSSTVKPIRPSHASFSRGVNRKPTNVPPYTQSLSSLSSKQAAEWYPPASEEEVSSLDWLAEGPNTHRPLHIKTFHQPKYVPASEEEVTSLEWRNNLSVGKMSPVDPHVGGSSKAGEKTAASTKTIPFNAHHLSHSGSHSYEPEESHQKAASSNKSDLMNGKRSLSRPIATAAVPKEEKRAQKASVQNPNPRPFQVYQKYPTSMEYQVTKSPHKLHHSRRSSNQQLVPKKADVDDRKNHQKTSHRSKNEKIISSRSQSKESSLRKPKKIGSHISPSNQPSPALSTRSSSLKNKLKAVKAARKTNAEFIGRSRSPAATSAVAPAATKERLRKDRHSSYI